MLSVPNMRSPEKRLLAGFYLAQSCFWCSCNFNPTVSLSVVSRKIQKPATALTTKKTKLNSSDSLNQTVGGHNKEKKKRVKQPSLNFFLRWLSLFLSQVSHADPVIAVVDGERGSEHCRQLLPCYKAQRTKFMRHLSSSETFKRICWQLMADDVVATLAGQVLNKGFRVVIASPDKDFKQLISEDVQIYNYDPQSALSLRCIVGDEVDGVPGIQHVVPSFGRKTAVKLVKKHGSLEKLLSAAAIGTVGKPYAQDALTKYADYLGRNYQVLALKRDVNVHLLEEWLVDKTQTIIKLHHPPF
ncbi:hypothetical protein Ahy_A05g021738 [Arachis hypogaea]|uniref:5'-3' exonuclease domain-containing protein n=1 Tax=Arachis hypogaea TaxID=3818 RepID=A0A445CY87_ARAHY|nr:hypothetical protein Ahy_A05g021738 [Arachis hypogaea]